LLENSDLRRFTPGTLTDIDMIMERLSRIREVGHSITRAELDPDVVGVAAPIRDESGRVAAAVSVAALATRVPVEREPEMVRQVQAAARWWRGSPGAHRMLGTTALRPGALGTRPGGVPSRGEGILRGGHLHHGRNVADEGHAALGEAEEQGL
jgi:hypothetical protein